MATGDWSSDVCSSDLGALKHMKKVNREREGNRERGRESEREREGEWERGRDRESSVLRDYSAQQGLPKCFREKEIEGERDKERGERERDRGRERRIKLWYEILNVVWQYPGGAPLGNCPAGPSPQAT